MPSQVVLVTGAATGIGNLTARALGAAGHTVFASMRDPFGRNLSRSRDLLEAALEQDFDLRVVELDVQSQRSAEDAVTCILDQSGRLDVVVHNAGHLMVGFAEAFTAEEIAHLMDVNVLGMQRVNRAVLPHLRSQGEGLLVYIGSTTSVVLPPFLAPYVASKAAFDALARTTAYEVGQFGIESTIVMPGPFTSGTEHFPKATRAGDETVTAAYAALEPMVVRNEEATAALFGDKTDADPAAVAEEVVRIVSLPHGERPSRTVVDFTDAGVERVNEVSEGAQRSFLSRMGFAELLGSAALSLHS
ncbi:SDR family NAD(P)-dependent oxidoreductase [Streptomyces pseudogriseolus]|uniref:SDR family NAD(P)-dependent oxidoreductase n=1 Tax=Streptomyces pseudogriseolus TaxID=36817 RepID=UPI003FA2E86B